MTFLKNNITRITALVIVSIVYTLARQPQISQHEANDLASQFSFEKIPLPEISDSADFKYVREVNPSLENISAWISAVGASAALNDIDGDGLANDVCYIDTRTDKVIIAPVPGTGDRYRPFELKVSKNEYDEHTMAPMGTLPGDINEDGRMDIIVYYWGRTPIAFLNNQHGYTEHEIVDSDERWYTNAASLADLDGDGHLDLIFGNYFADDARILDRHAKTNERMQHSMSRAYNAGANRLLLLKTIDKSENPALPIFEDHSSALSEEVARGWTLALGAADLDGDLLPEIYFANDFGPDRLLHNRSTPGGLRFAELVGREDFMTPSSSILGKDSFKGMGLDFGDINADGFLDLYVSNITAKYALHESHFLFVSSGEVDLMQAGIAPYVNESEKLGLSRSDWSWDARLVDFNNDGELEAIQATGFVKGDVDRWPELQELAMSNDEVVSLPGSWLRLQPGDDISGRTHNRFFVRAKDKRYYDIAKEIGIDDPHVTRGLAIADVDGDGDMDFLTANQWERSVFYRNDTKSANAYLILNLLLPLERSDPSVTTVFSGINPPFIKSRAAIGASVSISLPDGKTLSGFVDGGSGHSGKRSHEVHFGLGKVDKTRAIGVTVRWRDPSGNTHEETLALPPGRHSVVLAWPGEGVAGL